VYSKDAVRIIDAFGDWVRGNDQYVRTFHLPSTFNHIMTDGASQPRDTSATRITLSRRPGL
jgi:hypothetical protein